MIRCPDNQINASFIDISRIKWLVFLLWSSFFRTTTCTCSTVASSEAPADYQPAPGRTDGVRGEASTTMDYKSVFTNLCLELQQNRSWIKGLGKNPFTNSIPFTHSLTAVPFVRGHRSVFPRTPRNTGVYTRYPTFVTATSGVLTRLPAKLSKKRMRVYTLSDRRSKKNCVYNGLRSEGVNEKIKKIYSNLCIHSNVKCSSEEVKNSVKK